MKFRHGFIVLKDYKGKIMGSSKVSRTSNRISKKSLSGVSGGGNSGGFGSGDVLPEEETIVVALVNITNGFAKQKIGTPVIVRNQQVFANNVRIGDIPHTFERNIKNGTRGKVHDVQNGLVILFI